MSSPSVSGIAKLALKAGREVPGTAVRLLADDRAITVARRATGRAGLRYAVGGRTVLLVGTDIAEDRLRDAGAEVRAVSEADATDFAAGAPDVLVLCARPLAQPHESTDLEAAQEALETVYYGGVRAVLAALPAMRARRSGQVVVATAAARHAAAGDRAAAAALKAFARITAAEVAGDGVVVTQVNLPADPDRAAARICEALRLRPRIAPVRFPM